MFAGIIEGTRPVVELQTKKDGAAVLRVDRGVLRGDEQIGDSIAIDGVCLTVAKLGKGILSFDIMPETLRKTTIGSLKPGMDVNIEHSLRASDRIHGHFVQGHVFGLGTVTKLITKNEYKIRIDAGPLVKYIAPVGSIAVNGVSLTVAEIHGSEFTVSLIPVTLKLTNLGALRAGDQVNLEPDMIARQIVHFLEHRPSAVLGA